MQLLRKLRKLFAPKGTQFPFKLVLTQFDNRGCTFEITNSIEEWRVKCNGDEAEFLDLFLRELGPNDVVYDIGSCVGLYAIHAALLCAKVYAFEPDMSYRRRFLTNLDLNSLAKSVSVLDWAVSDRSGEALLFTDGVQGASPSLAKVGERGQEAVRTESIDSALANGSLAPPSVLKIDIEGAEILALRGMQHLLRSNQKPRSIFIELHPAFLDGFGSSLEECVSLIESFGYTRQYFRERDEQMHCIYKISPNTTHVTSGDI